MLITPAYAQASGDPFIVQLIPLTLLWIFFLIFGYFIVKRKGIGILGLIIGTIPVWGAFVLIWWASKTDKDVLDRLNRLEGSR
jgi:Na+-driven multidrug efflux pump